MPVFVPVCLENHMIMVCPPTAVSALRFGRIQPVYSVLMLIVLLFARRKTGEERVNKEESFSTCPCDVMTPHQKEHVLFGILSSILLL